CLAGCVGDASRHASPVVVSASARVPGKTRMAGRARARALEVVPFAWTGRSHAVIVVESGCLRGALVVAQQKSQGRPVSVDPTKVREFEDAGQFYEWLARNHDSADEVWIKIHKVGSGLKSIT